VTTNNSRKPAKPHARLCAWHGVVSGQSRQISRAERSLCDISSKKHAPRLFHPTCQAQANTARISRALCPALCAFYRGLVVHVHLGRFSPHKQLPMHRRTPSMMNLRHPFTRTAHLAARELNACPTALYTAGRLMPNIKCQVQNDAHHSSSIRSIFNSTS